MRVRLILAALAVFIAGCDGAAVRGCIDRCVAWSDAHVEGPMDGSCAHSCRGTLAPEAAFR